MDLYVSQGKYNLPEKVDGKPVVDSLSFQCSTLYRNWRFRLKEKHFRGKSLAEAKDSRPLTVDKDEWDWLVFDYWGSDKQKVMNYILSLKHVHILYCHLVAIIFVCYRKEVRRTLLIS